MKESIKTNIVSFIKEESFIISNHAMVRMIEKDITTDLLKSLLIKDEVIENYPDDFPCHSSLIFIFKLCSISYCRGYMSRSC